MSTQKQFNSFEELVTSSENPILVDFYAPWCGPCQLMSKVLEQAGEQLRGKVQIIKINTDNYPDLASKYQVYALPTMVLFKGGQPVHRLEGAMPAPDLLSRLEPWL
jgi:thioredoxin